MGKINKLGQSATELSIVTFDRKPIGSQEAKILDKGLFSYFISGFIVVVPEEDSFRELKSHVVCYGCFRITLNILSQENDKTNVCIELLSFGRQ